MRPLFRLFNYGRLSALLKEPSAQSVIHYNQLMKLFTNRYYLSFEAKPAPELKVINIETEGFKPMDARKLCKSYAIRKVKEVLQCNDELATRIVTENPEISWVPTSGMQETITFLKEKGFSEEQIHEHARLLLYLPSEIELKLAALSDVLKVTDVQVLVPLLLWTPTKVKAVARKWKEERRAGIPDKIEFLTNFLQCSPYTVGMMMYKLPFLPTFDFQRLLQVTKVFDAYGLQKVDLIRDFSVIKYNISVTEQRLKKAEEVGVLEVKPWMLRCTDQKFQKQLRKHETGRQILGEHTDILEYLKHRLNCSDEFIKSLDKRNPKPALTNIVKLGQLLDYLFKEGFTPLQVQVTPRILCHSIKLIQERMNVLKEFNHTPVNLNVLVRTSKEWETFKKKLEIRKVLLKN